MNGGYITGGGSVQWGSQVTLVAIPAQGFHFQKWTENGQTISQTPVYSFIAEGDRNFVAHFVNKDYILLSKYQAESSNWSAYEVLDVTADQPWVATPSAAWLTVTPNFGNSGTSQVMVSWLDNLGLGERQGSVQFHNDGSSATFALLQHGTTTSIADGDEDGVKVFPNPTRNRITIANLPEGASFYLADMLGQVFFRKPNAEKEEVVDLSDFPKGLYNLMIVTKTERKVVKVLKM
jgi:hypothetical protein